MHATETRALVTLSLLAAFVDGEKHERERAEIKRIAEGLSQADGVNLPSLYQDVLLKRVSRLPSECELGRVRRDCRRASGPGASRARGHRAGRFCVCR